ncbi:MAG: class I SAM-dependent methyltransferase [Promethearchaeota archaeon]
MDFPISSSIIIFSAGIFALSVVTSPKHRKVKQIKEKSKKNQRSLKNVKIYFNAHAKSWDEHVNHDPEKLRKIINKLGLKPDSVVLDVGTGTGVMIPYLNQYIRETGKIYAMDVSENMINIARNKYENQFSNIEFIIGDVCELEKIDGFDIVLCYSCFPHFLNQQLAINKITHLLKTNGKLMVAHSQSRKKINKIHKNVKGITSKDKLPPIKRVRKMMTDSGLGIIEMFDNDDIFYILAKKKMDSCNLSKKKTLFY